MYIFPYKMIRRMKLRDLSVGPARDPTETRNFARYAASNLQRGPVPRPYPHNALARHAHQRTQDNAPVHDPVPQFTATRCAVLSTAIVFVVPTKFTPEMMTPVPGVPIVDGYDWSMITPNLLQPVAVFPEYVTPATDASVASDFVLIRSAWSLYTPSAPLLSTMRSGEQNTLVDDLVVLDDDP